MRHRHYTFGSRPRDIFSIDAPTPLSRLPDANALDLATEAREDGYVVAGMTLVDDAITLDELAVQDHPRLTLVFGTEGEGLSKRT